MGDIVLKPSWYMDAFNGTLPNSSAARLPPLLDLSGEQLPRGVVRADLLQLLPRLSMAIAGLSSRDFFP